MAGHPSPDPAHRDRGHPGQHDHAADPAADPAGDPAGDPARPGRPGNGGARVRLIPCAGAIVRDEAGRLLLIQRGHQPGAGLWSLPGGRVEPGETAEQAVVREVAEETGLAVTCGPLAGTARQPAQRGAVYDIRDYTAQVTGGTLAAGDDADDARWVSRDELLALDGAGRLTSGLVSALQSWSVL